MKKTKSSSKNSSKKIKYTVKKNNVIFEDNSSPNVKVRFIFDKNKPFYEHNLGDGNGSVKF